MKGLGFYVPCAAVFFVSGEAVFGFFGEVYLFLKFSWPFFSSTMMAAFLSTFSCRIIFESSLRISFWMTRFMGLAPNWGS